MRIQNIFIYYPLYARAFVRLKDKNGIYHLSINIYHSTASPAYQRNPNLVTLVTEDVQAYVLSYQQALCWV